MPLILVTQVTLVTVEDAKCLYHQPSSAQKRAAVVKLGWTFVTKKPEEGRGGAASNVMQKLFSHQSGNAKTEI